MTRPKTKTTRAKRARKPKNIEGAGFYRLWASLSSKGAGVDAGRMNAKELRRLAKWCNEAALWLEARKP